MRLGEGGKRASSDIVLDATTWINDTMVLAFIAARTCLHTEGVRGLLSSQFVGGNYQRD
jgi:hypothetical protein